MLPSLTAITVALPHEAKGLLRHLQVQGKQGCGGGQLYRARHAGGELFVLQTGMGPERSAAATRALLEDFPVQGLLSTGYCGGLLAGMKSGDVVLAEELCSELATEAQVTSPAESFNAWAAFPGTLTCHRGKMISVARAVLQSSAKASLKAQSGAIAVDMESYFVLRACRLKKIPSLSLRFVVDAYDDDLTDTSAFVDPQGSFQPLHFLKASLKRPKMLLELPGLGRAAERARASLSELFGWALRTDERLTF